MITNNIDKRNVIMYSTFGGLYFTEGLINSISLVIVPLYLIDKNITLALVTLTTGTFLIPWSFKFILGGIVDKSIYLTKKQFIKIGILTIIFGLLMLAFINPTNQLIIFVIFLLILNTGVALLDVSVDGIAIEVSHRKERGKINGVMNAGFFTGMTFGNILFAYIAQSFGYNVSFFVAGICVFIIIPLAFLIKEGKRKKRTINVSTTLVNELKKKPTQLVIVFSSIPSISGGLIILAIPLFMRIVLNLDVTLIGLISALYPVSIIIGSIFGGFLTDLWGRRKILAAVLSLRSLIYMAFIMVSSWEIFAILYGLTGFLFGGYRSASSALIMDYTNPDISAAEYGLITSFINASKMGGQFISGSLIAVIGFHSLFLFSAWLFGPALVILSIIQEIK